MTKTFKIETGEVGLSEGASAEQAVKISIAVSLKRIADALEKKSFGNTSVFEEIFGRRG